MFALSAPVLLTLAGGVVDVSRANNLQAQLQGALDASVLAGAGDGTANRDSVALKVFNANLQPNAGPVPKPTFTLASDGSYSGKASAAVPTAFLGFIGMSNFNVQVQSTALLTLRAPLCVLTLDPTAAGAFEAGGTGTFTGNRCSVQVNSTSASGIRSTGSASARADEFCVAGGGQGSFTPAPKTGCRATPDPFAGLAKPYSSACDFTNMKVTSTKTLQPGVYCGGLSITGGATASFSPGTYVIKDGPLNIAVSNDLTGTDVTFFMTGANATVSAGGGGQIMLKAPRSGTYAGILFYQDPTAAPGAVSTLMADSSAAYEGVLYFPTQNLVLTGQGGGSSLAAWTSIVANTVRTTADGYYSFNASPSSVPFPPGLKRDTLRLTR